MLRLFEHKHMTNYFNPFPSSNFNIQTNYFDYLLYFNLNTLVQKKILICMLEFHIPKYIKIILIHIY